MKQEVSTKKIKLKEKCTALGCYLSTVIKRIGKNKADTNPMNIKTQCNGGNADIKFNKINKIKKIFLTTEVHKDCLQYIHTKGHSRILLSFPIVVIHKENMNNYHISTTLELKEW